MEKMNLAEQVYASLLGQLQPEYALDWVENIYTEGSSYDRLYADVLAAYARLCERLGADEEDDDVEIIINAMLDNERTVALKMFAYGVLYGKSTAKD